MGDLFTNSQCPVDRFGLVRGGNFEEGMQGFPAAAIGRQRFGAPPHLSITDHQPPIERFRKGIGFHSLPVVKGRFFQAAACSRERPMNSMARRSLFWSRSRAESVREERAIFSRMIFVLSVFLTGTTAFTRKYAIAFKMEIVLGSPIPPAFENGGLAVSHVVARTVRDEKKDNMILVCCFIVDNHYPKPASSQVFRLDGLAWQHSFYT